MWLRIAKKYQIGFIDDYLAYYRLHNDNFHKQRNKMFENQKKILEKWKNNKLYDDASKKINEFYFVSLSIYNKKYAVLFLFKNFFQIKKTFLFVKGMIKLFFIFSRKGSK